MFGIRSQGPTKTVVDQAESPDLSGASPIGGANEAGIDEAPNVMYATIDRFRFKSLYETISEILTAHGFVANIENILASLDFMKFGIRVPVPDADAATSGLRIQEYADCIQVKLPEKRREGPFLKLFYDEVGAYEAEIIRISGSVPQKASEKDLEIKQLRQQVERLVRDNESLTRTKEELVSTIQELEHFRSSAARVIEEQNLLPPNIKAGKVREINLEENRVVVKAGRVSIVIPVGSLNSLPQLGSGCLVVQKPNKEPESGIVFGEECEPFRTVIGEVLSFDGTLIKVRDERRQTWTAETKGSQLDHLRRGNRVLVKFAKDVPVSVTPLTSLESDRVLFAVQGEIITKQAGRRALKDDIEVSMQVEEQEIA